MDSKTRGKTGFLGNFKLTDVKHWDRRQFLMALHGPKCEREKKILKRWGFSGVTTGQNGQKQAEYLTVVNIFGAWGFRIEGGLFRRENGRSQGLSVWTLYRRTELAVDASHSRVLHQPCGCCFFDCHTFLSSLLAHIFNSPLQKTLSNFPVIPFFCKFAGNTDPANFKHTDNPASSNWSRFYLILLTLNIRTISIFRNQELDYGSCWLHWHWTSEQSVNSGINNWITDFADYTDFEHQNNL